jgi:hypothetical protein
MKTPGMAEVPATPMQPPPGYEKCGVAITILMADFFLEHMLRLYHEFDGDLVMSVVLGEIGHHNVSPFFTTRGSSGSVNNVQHLWSRKDDEMILAPCNAFSLSVATGIPRETIRCKVRILIKRGWVKQNEKGEIFLTAKPREHFVPEFNIFTLKRFLQTSQRIQEMLAEAIHPETHKEK